MNEPNLNSLIESAELDARLGLISGFDRFVRVAREQPEMRALVNTLSTSRAARVAIENRVEALTHDGFDQNDTIHPKDIALAVYVIGLHDVGSRRINQLASTLAGMSVGCWATRVSRAIVAAIQAAETSGLRFMLDWSESTCEDPSVGRLQAWIGGELVWGDSTATESRGVLFAWFELLAGLSTAWPRLVWEDGYPALIDARDPAEFDVKTRDYLDGVPARLLESTRKMLVDFRASHELATTVPLSLRPLWLVGQGRDLWIATDSSENSVLRSKRETLATLRGLGDEIAARMNPKLEPHARVLEAWDNVEHVEPEGIIAISTGLDRAEVHRIGAAPAFEFSVEEPVETELMAAARMLVTADYRAILPDVLAILRTVPAAGSTVQLEVVSAAARQALANLPSATKPHDRGYLAANWLREYLQVTDEPVVPRTILESWQVNIVPCELPEPELEAIAVWGPRHGPAVILNQHAKYSSEVRENITLAHEIAHLLLDRHDALPLAEVLGGNVPKLVEQRARAFAAELLLPRAIAGTELARASNPGAAVAELAARYRVSQEVIAWQAHNSEHLLPRHVESFLRTRVSKPQSY
jgi:Zn-dependent peptidase ImmA (M78 family)